MSEYWLFPTILTPGMMPRLVTGLVERGYAVRSVGKKREGSYACLEVFELRTQSAIGTVLKDAEESLGDATWHSLVAVQTGPEILAQCLTQRLPKKDPAPEALAPTRFERLTEDTPREKLLGMRERWKMYVTREAFVCLTFQYLPGQEAILNRKLLVVPGTTEVDVESCRADLDEEFAHRTIDEALKLLDDD